MYKLLLIRKYLLRRRIAWVALASVMLCTAMVLVVISVMGGWLNKFKEVFHLLNSDVVVHSDSLVGFPCYQEMIDEIQKIPAVAAAVPQIHSFGLININNQWRQAVEVIGIPIDQIGRVGNFPQTLYRQHELHPTAHPTFALLPNGHYKLWAGRGAKGDPTARTGIIVTDPVIGLNPGETPPPRVYTLPTTLTLLPVIPGQTVHAEDVAPVACWIVDTARSQVYQLDNDRVYVSIDELQKDLKMTEDPDNPARVSEIEIKIKPGYNLDAARDAVDDAVQTVEARHAPWPQEFPTRVATWVEIQADFIHFVEHEVVLTTALFAVISLVAVFLIFCIFYMIVVEKTKDIGIIKSVGATGGGILALFLGYGLAIGVVGAGLGLGLAYLVVHNINELHAWLGRRMGIVIWDPKAYQFPRIPSTMDPKEVAWIVSAAILSALLGAVVPALRAARMNPVEALRYE